MNINTTDFNLLKVFAAIYKTRNVSKAGEQIGLAQSSMSNALARLRDQFDDPLFQRTPQGMEPTHRAEQLAPKITQVINIVNEMINPVEFDPKKVTATLAIAASDLTITTLAPTLISQLNQQAPNIQVRFVPLSKQTVFNQLDDEDIEMAIGTFARVPARYHLKQLNDEHFVCIAKQQHPKIQDQITLSDFTQLQHALMTLNTDDRGVIDKALAKLGHKREIAMTCAQFSPLIDIVASSQLIATIPASMTEHAKRCGCDVYPLPFVMPTWHSELVVSQKFLASDLGRFMTTQIQTASGN